MLKLEKDSIIKQRIENKGTRKFPLYIANTESEIYKYYKKIFNLIELRELVQFLRDKLMPAAIILFGSYQRGEDIEESDIDLFVQSKEKKVELGRFRRKLGRNIQLHFQTDFSDYPKELKNNIVNGVVLYGYLEAF